MPIAFRGYATGSSINGANITLNLVAPTSGLAPAAGDGILVVASSFARAGNETRIGNALAYTELRDVTVATQRYRVAADVFAAGETSLVIEGSGNIADGMSATAIWFSGVDVDNPFSSNPRFTQAAGNSTNPAPAPIKPLHNDCVVVVLAAADNIDTAPGTMTNYIVLAGAAGNDTNDSVTHVAYRLLNGGSGVEEDPPAFSAWNTGRWAAVTCALKRAVPWNVSMLQRALNIAIWYTADRYIPITGVMDADTTRSIIEFQRVFDLPQTGTMGAAEWHALSDEMMRKFFAEGQF